MTDQKQPQPSVREKAREMYIQLETYDSFFAGLSADEKPLCWVKYMDKVVMPFIDQIITLAQEEKIKAIKKIPSRCRLCERQGVNTFGECECSFEDKQYLKKSDVIKILKL